MSDLSLARKRLQVNNAERRGCISLLFILARRRKWSFLQMRNLPKLCVVLRGTGSIWTVPR